MMEENDFMILIGYMDVHGHDYLLKQGGSITRNCAAFGQLLPVVQNKAIVGRVWLKPVDFGGDQ